LEERAFAKQRACYRQAAWHRGDENLFLPHYIKAGLDIFFNKKQIGLL